MRKAAWTEADLAKLKQMIAAGASAARISVALRRSLDSVKNKARDLGTPLPLERDLARERKKILSAEP